MQISSNFVFSFLDSVPLGFIVLNTDFTIFYVNKYFSDGQKIPINSLNDKPFSAICKFDIKKHIKKTENFQKYQEIEITIQKNLVKNYFILVTNLTITMGENETKDLYVLILLDPLHDEIDQVKFQEWIKSTKTNISLIIYAFESGSGPYPLYIVNDSIFKNNDNNLKDKSGIQNFTITKIGLYFMTAIGQGITQSTGLFGPLPVPGVEFENYNSIVYALHLKDKKQKDPRTQGTRYTLVTIVYPKNYERLLLDRRRIRSIILNYFQIDDISDLNQSMIDNLYNEILFSPESREHSVPTKSIKRKKGRRRITSNALDSKLNEITGLTTRIRDIYELDHAIEEISVTAEKCVNFKLLAIFGVDRFTNELYILKTKGYYDYKIKSMRIPISNNDSVVSKTAQLMKTVLIRDVKEIDYYLQIDPNIKADLAVPIKIKNELLGVIIVESDVRDSFTQDDITILELIAEITASKIDLHRNENIGHDLNVLLNNFLFITDFNDAIDEITRFAEILLNFEIFCILDTREDEVKFLSYRGYGSPEDLPKIKRDDKEYFVCQPYINKESVYIDNLQEHPEIPYYVVNSNVTSEYCIPIIMNSGEVVGLINVETMRPLERHELVIFETLANYTKLLFRIHFKN